MVKNIRQFVFVFLLILLALPVCSQILMNRKDSAAYNTSLIQVDKLLLKIEIVSSTLDSINKITKNGFDTREIDADLPQILDKLKIINDNLVLYGKVLNVKNLQMFEVMLEDTKADLTEWRSSLFQYNKELVKMKTTMINFANDTTLKIIAKDTVFRHLYQQELKDIKEKWIMASHFTTNNLLKITQLQAKVSKAYFQTLELEQMVFEKLGEFRRRNLGKEYDPIYAIKKNSPEDQETVELVKKAYKGQREILEYYIIKHWERQVLILIVGVGFFLWVFNNFRKVRKAGIIDQLKDSNFKYINEIPVLATLILIFNLAPFFDLNPPSAYVEMTQFFLLIVLSILFIRNRQKPFIYYWLAIMVLYILTALVNGSITPGIKTRSILLLLSIVSVLFGIMFAWKIKKALSLPPSVKVILVIYLVLNFLAGICNIFGRVSLAKVLSMSAIFGLTQIVGLSVFIQLLSEAFLLQMKSSKLIGGIVAKLNYDKILWGLNKALSVVIIVLWLIIFASNLGIYSPVYEGVRKFLTASRAFGNISFTLGNVFLFFLIVYISNLLQKYVGYFFTDSDEDFVPDKYGSRLVVIRLVLLIIGFLLAITASGLPLDKITIVLGALGVGIGLGLQNIVNNLVSGLILIFEKPFEIGDSIEVGNKKGRVKDMGIRSSRLITADGSEIIVPNGDLLSGQVINWSKNDETIRSEILVKVEPDCLPSAKEQIIQVLNNHPGVIRKNSYQVLVSALATSGVEVKIRFWIGNIRKEQEIRSDLLISIYKKFKENNIKIL